MPEIIYHFPGKEAKKPRSNIRWLSVNDLNIFNEHLSLCGQGSLDQSTWDEIYNEGTQYCVLFVDSVPAARACVEKYSADAWEVADVRVARPFRNRGLAFDVCYYVLQDFLDHGKIATIRTEEDNTPMQRVIEKLGFVPTTGEYQ